MIGTASFSEDLDNCQRLKQTLSVSASWERSGESAWIF